MSKKKYYTNTKTKDKTCKTNKYNDITSSFLRTELESSEHSVCLDNQGYRNKNQKNQNQNDIDEIMLKYLNLKTKLNGLWNKLG